MSHQQSSTKNMALEEKSPAGHHDLRPTNLEKPEHHRANTPIPSAATAASHSSNALSPASVTMPTATSLPREQRSHAMRRWLSSSDDPWSPTHLLYNSDPGIFRVSGHQAVFDALLQLELEGQPSDEESDRHENPQKYKKKALPPAPPPSPIDDSQRLPHMAPTA